VLPEDMLGPFPRSKCQASIEGGAHHEVLKDRLVGGDIIVNDAAVANSTLHASCQRASVAHVLNSERPYAAPACAHELHQKKALSPHSVI
jgi:hypothetical protein